MARVWLITGASSGFGHHIAEAALAVGDHVIGAVRCTESLDDLVASSDGRATAVALDLTDPDRIGPAVDEALAAHGRVDVLVNNAGAGLVGAAEDTTDSELRDLMELHFFGPVALTRALLPHMREQGSGAIVQMSSQGGRFSFPGVSGYSATKFALEGWSEALAGELEPFGIRVLIVEPGAFRTSFNTSGALRVSEGSAAYRDVIGPVEKTLREGDGSQPGDPAKAAEAIVSALGADEPPLRLALGSDAADAVGEHLDAELAEFSAWESVTRGTDFED